MTRCLSITEMLLLLIGPALAAESTTTTVVLPTSPGYVMTDLGSLGGGGTVPAAINVEGDIAGYSMSPTGAIHAFLLPAGGTMKDLGAMGGTASYATSLNNRGDVAGYFTTSAGQTHAFAILDGRMTDLGLASGTASKAVGVNDLGQVLVVSTDNQGNAHSLLWQNGQTVPLGTLGGSFMLAGGLNNLGQVVGSATAADGTNHGFAYDLSTHQLVDLGDIGAKGTLSHVNEIGQAVGTLFSVRGKDIAFGVDLKAAGPFANKTAQVGLGGTDAYWINNENTTVGIGELRAPPGGVNAVLWTADGPLLNLNQALAPSSGWVVLSAASINDAGLVVGTALAPNGPPIAYVLGTPGPELSVDTATKVAGDMAPAIDAMRKGAAAAVAAAALSPLATTLTDLQQARLLLTPPAGQNIVSAADSGEVSHLLGSAENLLLTAAGNSPFLSPTDLDIAESAVAAAQKSLQQ